jgi:MFS family permease
MRKKAFLFWFTASAAVMLLLPWLAVTFGNADTGMGITLALFFAVDPVYSVLVGIFAGKDVRKMWSLPIISAALFLPGAWIFLAGNETSFFLYAGVYLALGIAAMLVSCFAYHKIRQ